MLFSFGVGNDDGKGGGLSQLPAATPGLWKYFTSYTGYFEKVIQPHRTRWLGLQVIPASNVISSTGYRLYNMAKEGKGVGTYPGGFLRADGWI